KTVTIGKPLHPTGAIESDIKILKEFFKGSIGKIAKYT
ncbi:MAG: acyltransferase, partial [Flavobacteriaceae bacterium]|nr:acyltransferase [Flavobacteriaceae bacterium]